MLSIFLTEELEKHTRETGAELLFVFCSSQDEKRNTATTVLRGLVYQLLSKRPDLFKHVSAHFEGRRLDDTIASPDALWIVLGALLLAPELGNVFCILDGLDECDEAASRLLTAKFRHFFSPERAGSAGGRFQLAIVSRRISGLDSFPQVRLDPDNDKHVESDIRKFISSSVRERLKVPGFNDTLRKTVEDELLVRSQGTFLWVGFVVAELSKKSTCTEIMETLESLPLGLPAIYDRMLLRTDNSRRPVVAEILRWVTVAVRPLTLRELAAAIRVQPTADLGGDEVVHDRITWCGPILKIHNDNVGLIHQSAKDYLLRDTPGGDPVLEAFRIKSQESHAELTRVCLDCIERSDLQDGYVYIDHRGNWSQSVVQKSPLLPYAAVHWAEHARHASTLADEHLSLERPLLKKESLLRKHWWSAYFGYQAGVNKIRDRDARLLTSSSQGTPPVLHLAALFGLCSLVRKMLSWMLPGNPPAFISGINARDSGGNAALSFAVLGGHEAVVQLLLERGAEGQIRELRFATSTGNETMVRLLLDNDVSSDIHTALTRQGTLKHRLYYNPVDEAGKVLTNAARQGHEAVMRLLLAHGTYVDTMDELLGNTALMEAAEEGHEAVVRLLLVHGASVEIANVLSKSALTRAARRGHEAVVRLLLDHRSSVDASNDFSNSAFIAAIVGGHKSVVQVFLDRGTSYAHTRDSLGSPALILAAQEGHEAVVQLLLDHKSSVDTDGNIMNSALRVAAWRGHQAVVRLLLDYGSSVDAEDDVGRTPLIHAAERGHEGIVHLLLDRGSNVNAQAKCGTTALIEAAGYRDEGMVRLLLAYGANVEMRNNEGERARDVVWCLGDSAAVLKLLDGP
jgi:ankyrin repeat protein